MKTEIKNLEFVVIDEVGIADFKDYIIPQVYSEIYSLDSFEDEMIFAVGAVAGGKPIGAIIAQLLESDEIYIHSIIVDKDYRRMGIGTQLLNAAIQIGEEDIDPNPGEDYDFKAFVHTEYALSGEDLAVFDDFLKKNAFADFFDYPPVYIFDSEKIAKIGKPCANAIPFSAMDGITQDEIEEFFNDQGIYPETELSFFNGTVDQPKCLLMVQNLKDGVYTVSSTNEAEDGNAADLEELFLAAIDAISKREDRFKLVVNCAMNAYPELWDKYEKLCMIKSTHREAGLYIVFE